MVDLDLFGHARADVVVAVHEGAHVRIYDVPGAEAAQPAAAAVTAAASASLHLEIHSLHLARQGGHD